MTLSNLKKILDEFNLDNSRLYKADVFKKNICPELISLFHYAYDKLTYTYGISVDRIKNRIAESGYVVNGTYDYDFTELEVLLIALDKRLVSGNAAEDKVIGFYLKATDDSRYILERILDRDLKIGFNVKEFNKAVKKEDRIFVPPYMRCSMLDQLKNVKYPAFLQVKMDGTYRTIIKTGSRIETFSRQGEQYEPSNSILDTFKDLPDAYYIGELIVDSAESRSKSNGLLNSLEVQEDVSFYCWDVLTKDEFLGNVKSPVYAERFKRIPDNTGIFKKVETFTVNSIDEVFDLTKQLVLRGEEGSVVKDSNSIFENKTSKYQIKIKPEFDIEVRCSGFIPGKGRRASTFGSMSFKTDDGMIQGNVGSFTDAQLKTISDNKDFYIGKVFTLKGNALTKADGSDYYAVQYPRFVCFRDDKSETDTLERAKEVEKAFFTLKSKHFKEK